MRSPQASVHRTILAVDMERFSDRRRTRRHQVAARAGMYRALRTSLARCGVPWKGCYHEDRGDGALVLIPPEVPKNLLAASWPTELATRLAKHNVVSEQEARIRLRVAIHAGEVQADAHGIVGGSVVLAFRLLEATVAKTALAESPGLIVLIASDWFFNEVIRHEPACLPATYRRNRVLQKETDTTGWIARPDHPYPPHGDEGAAVLPALGSGQTIPKQLPAAVPSFVGREAELAELDRLLVERADQGGSIVISAISGTAGVGKTALAVQWAHRVRDRFPDGQLYVNLHGYDAVPARSLGQVLDGFLRALDVPVEKLPTDVETQAGLYRSITDGRRMLVVLDNAGSAEQVRPLLPASPGSLALITSRSRLSGLVARDGAHRVNLAPLSPTEALTLLRRIIGAARVDADLPSAIELTRRCAFLPLALRIVAERIATCGRLALTELLDMPSNEPDWLGLFSADDDHMTAIRSAFSWSYRALAHDAKRMFRLLGLHLGPDISTSAAAALTSSNVPQARRLLETLTSVHLLERTRHDRYHFHDLLRGYAIECAAAEDSEHDRVDAARRVLSWYLHSADAAHRVLLPDLPSLRLDSTPATIAHPFFQTYQDAMEWYDLEHANLVAATRHAGEISQFDIAWKLPAVLFGYFNLRKAMTDWFDTHDVGIAAADHLNDRYGAALLRCSLGHAHREMGHLDKAIHQSRRSLDICREIGFRWGEAAALYNLGGSYRDVGRLDEALDCLQHALALFRATGSQQGISRNLTALGTTYQRLGRLDEALPCHEEALAVYQEIGDRQGEGVALVDLGATFHKLGRFTDASDHLQRARAIHQQTNDPSSEARTMQILGDVSYDNGEPAAAHTWWREALAILDDPDDPTAPAVRARLDGTGLRPTAASAKP